MQEFDRGFIEAEVDSINLFRSDLLAFALGGEATIVFGLTARETALTVHNDATGLGLHATAKAVHAATLGRTDANLQMHKRLR